MTTSAITIVDNPGISNSIPMPSVPTTSTIQAVKELAYLAAQSGMAKTRTSADAFFIAMYGIELGIAPMTALRTIYSVNGGPPTCSGEAMLSLLRRSGKVRVTVPDPGTITDSATITIKRTDTGESGTFTFTMEMAQKAGLVRSGGNWTKYPHMMLIWRAVSMGAKLLCSDIIGGLYTVEEIAPHTPVNEHGEPVGEIIIEEPAPAEKLKAPDKIIDIADHVEHVDQPAPTVIDDWDADKAKAQIGYAFESFGLDAKTDSLRVIKALQPPESASWTKFSDAADMGMSLEDVLKRIGDIAKGTPAPAQPTTPEWMPEGGFLLTPAAFMEGDIIIRRLHPKAAYELHKPNDDGSWRSMPVEGDVERTLTYQPDQHYIVLRGKAAKNFDYKAHVARATGKGEKSEQPPEEDHQEPQREPLPRTRSRFSDTDITQKQAKTISHEEMAAVAADIWVRLGMPPDEFYSQYDIDPAIFSGRKALANHIGQTIRTNRVPVIVEAMIYSADPTGKTKKGLFQVPEFNLQIRRYGVRTWLTEQLGEAWSTSNKLDTWEPSTDGSVYAITPVQVSFELNQNSVMEATAVTAVTEETIDDAAEAEQQIPF